IACSAAVRNSPVRVSGSGAQNFHGFLPPSLDMDSEKQPDIEEMPRMVDENRKAIERIKEDLRKLKRQMGIEQPEDGERPERTKR
ncbi:MAG TPA: hypothetical protein VK846_08895, partial [Candidatus Limnocylindria bacterium]|nr:hypothetical protein [Candidatus Limnocylindria bacterium]